MPAITLPPENEERNQLLASLAGEFRQALPRYGWVPVHLAAGQAEQPVAEGARELMRDLGYQVELTTGGAAGGGGVPERYLFDPLAGHVHDVGPGQDPAGETHRGSVQAARDALTGPLVRRAVWRGADVQARGRGAAAGAMLPRLGGGEDQWWELAEQF